MAKRKGISPELEASETEKIISLINKITSLNNSLSTLFLSSFARQVGSRASAESALETERRDSKMMAVMLRPDCSASTIANEAPEKYDVFAQVCGPGSYVPNLRLQQLLEAPVAEESATQLQCEMVQSLVSVDTFRKVDRDGEPLIGDHNLQIILSIMASYSEKSLISAKRIPSSSMYMAKSVIPDHCLFAVDGPRELPLFVGAEAKVVEAFVRQCYPQLIALCGNSCLELYRIGLSLEDCVVPGVAIAGASCQFLAMYLLRDSFPVLMALSPLLSPFGTWDEQKEIAKWCLRLVAFARDRVEKVRACGECRSSPAPAGNMDVCLNMRGYFAKPVKNGVKFRQENTNQGYDEIIRPSDMSIRLNEIMRIYERLRVTGLRHDINMGRLLIFPEGVVSVPDEDVQETKALRKLLVKECEDNGFRHMNLEFRPVILFPRLSPEDGWTNDKPAHKMQQQLYMEQLEFAVDALNKAGIAHLDLRPANVLWREVEHEDASSVELRLIDFEDAVPFGHVIPPELVRIIVNTVDYRYPFQCGDEQCPQLARALHNNFFLEAIRQWISSEVKEFSAYMEDGNGLEILRSLLAP